MKKESGMKAPKIRISDLKTGDVKVYDFSKKRTVLYPFSVPLSPSGARQALAFSQLYDKMKDAGAEVMGICFGSEEDAEKIREKYSLRQPLVADPEGRLPAAYGFLHNGEISHGTVVVGADGFIDAVFENKSRDAAASNVLRYLEK